MKSNNTQVEVEITVRVRDLTTGKIVGDSVRRKAQIGGYWGYSDRSDFADTMRSNIAGHLINEGPNSSPREEER